MSIFWGDIELYAETIDMPPAEKNFEERELVPAPRKGYVPAEVQNFLVNNKLQLHYYPVQQDSEEISSLSGTVYTRGVDYTIDYKTGLVTRIPTGSIGIEQTVSCKYQYNNITPASTISSYGRMRRRVTVEGWAHYSTWQQIILDYEQDVKRNLTLPNGEVVLMYISRIPRTTRQRGQNWVYYTLEFIEA